MTRKPTYHIRVNPYYYAGTIHAPASGPIRGDDDEASILLFSSPAEARAWLARHLGGTLRESDAHHGTYHLDYPGPICLAYGQYAQTDYTIERSRFRRETRLVA